MKKSVNYWMVGGFEGAVPVLEAAKGAKAMGYDAIELCFGPGEFSPEADTSTLESLRDGLARLEMPVASLATGHYWGQSLASPDEAERTAALDFSKAYIRAAAAVGAGAVLVIPGTVDVPFDASRPVVAAREVWERSIESIRLLLPLAEAEGVTLCLENVWNKFLTGPFEFASFIDVFDSPCVKAYFDVGNCLLMGYPEQWAEILGTRIGRVHVKNFRCEDGGGRLSGFTSSLLDGDVNWAAVLPALRAAGFDGYLTAEVIVSEKGMPDNGQAAQVCREMAQLLAEHG